MADVVVELLENILNQGGGILAQRPLGQDGFDGARDKEGLEQVAVIQLKQ